MIEGLGAPAIIKLLPLHAVKHVVPRLLLAVLVLIFGKMPVRAADVYWTGAGDGLNWQVTENWSGNVPGLDDRVFFVGSSNTRLDGTTATIARLLLADASSTDDCTLTLAGATLHVAGGSQPNVEIGTVGHGTLNITSGSEVTVAARIRMGVDNGQPGARGTLRIDESSLIVEGPIIMGAGNATQNTHTLEMESGLLRAQRLLVADEDYATAIVHMRGGTMVLNDLAIPTNLAEPGLHGHFQLDGGMVEVYNPSIGGLENQPSGFRLANGPAIFSVDPAAMNTGTMDITGGTLLLTGDARGLIETYIADQVLTAYGGAGRILIDFDDSNSGFTTIRAVVPEPGTFALLIGGLVSCFVFVARSARFKSRPRQTRGPCDQDKPSDDD